MKRTKNAALAMAASALMAVALAGCAPAVAAQDGADETQGFRTVHDWAEPREPEGAVRVVQEMQERAQAEQEAAGAAIEAEAEYEAEYYEEAAYGGSGNSYGNSFYTDGVAYLGDTEFKWYSQNVKPGGGLDELNANGRHVDGSTGFVVDGDGYIAVASPWGRDEIGTVVETPYGQGKVYDENRGDAYDIFTDF